MASDRRDHTSTGGVIEIPPALNAPVPGVLPRSVLGCQRRGNGDEQSRREKRAAADPELPEFRLSMWSGHDLLDPAAQDEKGPGRSVLHGDAVAVRRGLAREFLDSVLLLALTSNKNAGLTEVFLQIETNAVIWDTGMRYYARSVNTLVRHSS